MTEMKVAVMGGGNGSHTVAADLALKGLQVNMFEMEQFADSMKKVFETKEIEITGAARNGKAKLHMVTTNIKEAVEGMEVIFLPLPGFALANYARLLSPHLEEGQIILLMPGTLGSLELRARLDELGCKSTIAIAETGGLPFATRLSAPGRVNTLHVRATLALGTMPGSAIDWVFPKVKDLYPFVRRETVLQPAFEHITPFMHPEGVILNAGRIERAHGEYYFYEESFSPGVVKTIEALDRERIEIACKAGVKFPTVAEMLFESDYGPNGTLFQAVNGSQSLTAVKGHGSLSDRYLTEDLPYSLTACACIGHALGIKTPVMDAFVEIGGAMLGMDCWKEGRNLARMGLEGMCPEEVLNYLRTGKRG